MALTEIPIELSSTPSIVDNGNATAITIGSDESATFAGNILHAGDLTLDVAGDIILDAGGAQIRFHDDGTDIGVISNESNNLIIKSQVSDADLIFKGNDGGSSVTALRLDMSSGGTAFFNKGVNSDAAQGNTAFYARTVGSYMQVNGASSNVMAFGMTGGSASPATAASTSLGFHHWNNSSWANPVSVTRDGITFNGETAAAHALDDYEYGTFTLTIKGGGQQPSTLITTTGTFVKVGSLVNVQAKFSNKNMSGYSGSVILDGLPCPITDGASGSVVVYRMATWTDNLGFEPSGTNAVTLLNVRSGTTWQTADHTALTSQCYLYFNYSYQTSA